MKRAAILALLALSTGCNAKRSDGAKAAAESESPSASASASVASGSPSGSPSGAASAGAAPWLAVPSATAPLLPNMPFGERFEVEKGARPALKPNVEDALAALRKAGLSLSDPKQHLAQPFGARYCVGSDLKERGETVVFVSVCEYVSPELAASAAAHSEQSLKALMPTRTVRAHRHLALIARPASEAPTAIAARDKAQATFDAL